MSKQIPDLKQGTLFYELFDTFMLTSAFLLEIMILSNTVSRNRF